MPPKKAKTNSNNQLLEQIEEEEPTLPQASSSNTEPDKNANPSDSKVDQILKELREFRQDNREQLAAMREDLNGIGGRMDEAEQRIDAVETRVQSWEDLLIELAKLHTKTEAKLTELEGNSRRQNIRIYGVAEGAEESATSAIKFIETLLMNGLSLPPLPQLAIERAHRALAAKPQAGAPPRSFVVKFANYRTKEDILKKAWQAKGFDFQGKRVYLDNDYAPEIQRRRKEYNGAKAALRDNNIRFQTPYPYKLKVFYNTGTITYNSAQEATEDMAERGNPSLSSKDPCRSWIKLSS